MWDKHGYTTVAQIRVAAVAYDLKLTSTQLKKINAIITGLPEIKCNETMEQSEIRRGLSKQIYKRT